MCRVIPGSERTIKSPRVGWKVFHVTPKGLLRPLYMYSGGRRKRAGETYTTRVGTGYNIFLTRRDAMRYARSLVHMRNVRVHKVYYRGKIMDAVMEDFQVFNTYELRIVTATTMTIDKRIVAYTKDNMLHEG